MASSSTNEHVVVTSLSPPPTDSAVVEAPPIDKGKGKVQDAPSQQQLQVIAPPTESTGEEASLSDEGKGKGKLQDAPSQLRDFTSTDHPAVEEGSEDKGKEASPPSQAQSQVAASTESTAAEASSSDKGKGKAQESPTQPQVQVAPPTSSEATDAQPQTDKGKGKARQEPPSLTNLSRHHITNAMVFGPVPNREYHEGFMRKAIEMAEMALASDETPVGCVFVREGEVIGRGINGTNASLNGTRHAEFVALCEIMSRHHPSILRETDLYVTVEPCVMCASALRQFGIRSVYFGCLNDRFGGTGGVMTVHMDEGEDPPYPVYGGLFREEAIMLLRRFYVQENDKAPEPKPKKNRELKTEILPVNVATPATGSTPAAGTPALASPAVATPATEAPATETPTD